MSSQLYDIAVDEILKANIDLVNDDISVLLVSDYTPDFTLDRTQADISEESQVVELSLIGKTIDEGRFLADDVLINGISSEEPVTGVVIMKNSDSQSTTTLIGFMDGTGFPFTPDGSPITIEWDRSVGGPGIFKI